MKKPYITQQEREYLKYNIAIADFIKFRLAWGKFLQSIKKEILNDLI